MPTEKVRRERLALASDALEKAALLVVIGQAVAALGEAIGAARQAVATEAGVEKVRLVMRLDRIEAGHDVLETVGPGDETAIVGAEERAGEIIQRSSAAG